jgi:hypothetical protein
VQLRKAGIAGTSQHNADGARGRLAHAARPSNAARS